MSFFDTNYLKCSNYFAGDCVTFRNLKKKCLISFVLLLNNYLLIRQVLCHTDISPSHSETNGQNLTIIVEKAGNLHKFRVF